jgi:hypothetical protein
MCLYILQLGLTMLTMGYFIIFVAVILLSSFNVLGVSDGLCASATNKSNPQNIPSELWMPWKPP